MSIENRVINGGFETGTFSPWVASNATITSQFSHSGSFVARLLGGNVNSFIFQYVEANPTERFEFLVSLVNHDRKTRLKRRAVHLLIVLLSNHSFSYSPCYFFCILISIASSISINSS